MKHYFISFTLLTLVLISGIGCSQNDERDSFKDSTKEVLTKRISLALDQIIQNESEEYNDGGYIAYDAGLDSIVICDEFAYNMGNIVYDHLQKSTEVKSYAIGTQHKISKPIWLYIGQCKTKWGAYKLANTLMYKIPNDADFENIKKMDLGKYGIGFFLHQSRNNSIFLDRLKRTSR